MVARSAQPFACSEAARLREPHGLYDFCLFVAAIGGTHVTVLAARGGAAGAHDLGL
jgi:hypothetical protein